MGEILTTEQAIKYLESLWQMNDANITLAKLSSVSIDQEELWAHEALALVLLQAKSNLYLQEFNKKTEDKE